MGQEALMTEMVSERRPNVAHAEDTTLKRQIVGEAS